MFNPTIFDNLKAVVEGEVYSRDASGEVSITARRDVVDLAAMSRTYAIQVRQPNGHVQAGIELFAGADDLAGELLADNPGDMYPSERLGCALSIHFSKEKAAETWCDQSATKLGAIWETSATLKRHFATVTEDQATWTVATVTLLFNRKINERQIDDVPSLVDYVVRSLRELEPLD